MRSAKLRPSTPPSDPGLLTPPSTGGREQQRASAKLQDALKRQEAAQEEETLADFFEEHAEASDIEASSQERNSDNHTSCIYSDSSFQVPVVQRATSLTVVLRTSTLDPVVTRDLDNLPLRRRLLDVSTAHKYFPFLKLPLSIRQRIYSHLLVIPALICVRQKHTSYHDNPKAFLFAERRELLPGIAYALAQVKVDGPKTRFSRFEGININILRTNKEVFTEARAVVYANNSFEIVRPTNELTPQPDFSVPLFPPACQRLVTKLTIRTRTFYDLDWLLNGGFNVMRNYYRGLNTLTLILELNAATKGFGREWTRKPNEKWPKYIKRLHVGMAKHLFGSSKAARGRQVPTWVELRVLFSGEGYCGSERRASCSHGTVDRDGVTLTSSMRNEFRRQEELSSALVETWELFKKGGK